MAKKHILSILVIVFILSTSLAHQTSNPKIVAEAQAKEALPERNSNINKVVGTALAAGAGIALVSALSRPSYSNGYYQPSYYRPSGYYRPYNSYGYGYNPSQYYFRSAVNEATAGNTPKDEPQSKENPEPQLPKADTTPFLIENPYGQGCRNCSCCWSGPCSHKRSLTALL